MRCWLPSCAVVTLVACATAAPARPGLLAQVEVRPDVDGRRLPARAGAPTAVLFFASWCEPCRRELGELAALQAESPELRIVLVNAFEDWGGRSDAAAMRAYLAAQRVPWPVVPDSAALRRSFGGIVKIPALFLFDGGGREVARYRRQDGPLPPLEVLRRDVRAVTGRAALGPGSL